jgi:hypothetical protein
MDFQGVWALGLPSIPPAGFSVLANATVYYDYHANAFFVGNPQTQDWELYSYNVEPQIVGDGKQEKEFIAGTLPGRYQGYDSSGAYKLLPPAFAYSETNGFSSEAVLDIPLKLLFWRGQRPTFSGPTYPMAQAGCHNEEPMYLRIGDYSLNLKEYADGDGTGDKGIIEVFHTPWLNFMANTKKVTAITYLSFTELLALPLYKKVRIDRVDYLSAKRSYNIYKDHIGPQTQELYKI